MSAAFDKAWDDLQSLLVQHNLDVEYDIINVLVHASNMEQRALLCRGITVAALDLMIRAMLLCAGDEFRIVRIELMQEFPKLFDMVLAAVQADHGKYLKEVAQ